MIRISQFRMNSPNIRLFLLALVVSVTVIAAANIHGGVVIAIAMAALVIVIAAQVFTNNRLEVYPK